MTNDMREKFEKWIIDGCAIPEIRLTMQAKLLNKLDSGDYVDQILFAAYKAWSAAISTNTTTKLDINKMVSNFLSWKLPSDFYPDCGISFEPNILAPNWRPMGTNLFHAGQAKAMIEAMLEGVELGGTDAEPVLYQWLDETCNEWTDTTKHYFPRYEESHQVRKLFTAPPPQPAETNVKLGATIADQAATILQLQAESKVMRETLEEANKWMHPRHINSDVEYLNAKDKVRKCLSTQPSTTLAEHDEAE